MAGFCRDWPRTIFAASYKGVPFEVDVSTVRGGRRIVTHEYPTSENWDNEDLGRAKQVFDVTGYTFGDDADAWAHRLYDACNSPGSGLLTLPTMASRRARNLTVASTFKKDEMGRIGVDMTFVREADSQGGLFSVSMLVGAVLSAVKTAALSLSGDFASAYNAMAAPNVVRETAAETVRLAAVALEAAARSAPMDMDKAPLVLYQIRRLGEEAHLLSFSGEGQNFLTDSVFSGTTRKSTTALSARLIAAISDLGSAIRSRGAMAEAFLPLLDFTAQDIAGRTSAPSARMEVKLTRMVADHVRGLALLKWAEGMTLAGYPARAQAIEARASVVQRIDTEIDDAASGTSHAALIAVRNAAVEYLTKNGIEAPAAVKIATPVSVPAITLAYEIYGDAGRDTEIMARNGLFHPLGCPLFLEVLRP